MIARLAVMAAVCGFPLGAYAQIFTPSPSDGIDLPDESVAAQDDAASLEVNPAGLAFMETGEFGFGFESPKDDLEEVADRSSAFFAAWGNGVFGTGFAAQSLEQPPAGPALDRYNKYTWGLSLALPRTLAVGLNVHWFGSAQSQRVDEMVAYDVGVQWRLGEHLALGMLLRDFNEPFVSATDAVRTRTSFGIQLRLFDGRLQIDSTSTTVPDVDALEWTPRVMIEPLGGLRLFASALASVDNRTTQGEFRVERLWGGVELSFGSFGLAYAPAYTVQPDDSLEFTHVRGYHWFSGSKQRSLAGRSGRWVTINLNASMSETPTSGLFGGNGRTFLETVVDLERVSRDPSVAGILLIAGDSENLGYAQAWELREQVAKVRASGKHVVAYLTQQTAKDYYVGSAAEKVWVYPTEPFDPNDTQARLVSYKGVLQTVGVEAEFVRIGSYKSASEMFTHEEPSEASVEQTSKIVDGLFRTIRSAWAKDRAKSPEELERILAQRPLFPNEARAQGMIDGILYPDELEQKLVAEFPGARLEAGYEQYNDRDQNWGGRPKVAVVVIDGNIVSGNSVSGFLGGGTGGQTIQEVAQALAKDDQVAAVVVRINSPGGSAVASDQMFRALQRLGTQKPVIASMGDAAASGGYYAAAGAREIFATPLTVTGSIGIFAGKFNAAGLFSWLGVRSKALPAGRTNSDYYESWTADERRRVESEMLFRYRTFLQQISSTRALTADEFDKVGRGRVWLGQEAAAQRLVDHVGGLMDAVRRAESLAGIAPGEAEYEMYPEGGPTFSAGVGISLSTWLGLTPAQDATMTLLLDKMRTMPEFGLLLPVFYESGEALMLPEHQIILK